MKSTTLRRTRIAVSIAIFLLLNLAIVAPMLSLKLPFTLTWLQNLQIVPALLAYSFFTFVMWLMITLLVGRVYCSMVCPLGMVQDIAARCARLKPGGRRYRYTTPREKVRYLFLYVMFVALILQNMFVAYLLDPYSSYALFISNILEFTKLNTSTAMAVIAIILPAIVIALAVYLATRNGRTLCNTVCPVGTTLGLVSRYAIFQIYIDTDKCINCFRCADACKGACIDLKDHVVDGSRCVGCFDCLPVCPNDAIHFTHRRKRLSIPMMQAITDPMKKERGTVSAINIQSPQKQTIKK